MSKNLEAKKVVVSEISEKLKNCQSMVVVHFNGITVENETGTMTLPVQYCRGLTIRDLTCTARK